jgi:hypothetical protein
MTETVIEKKPVFKLRKKKKAEPEIRKEAKSEDETPLYALAREVWDDSLKVGDSVTTRSLYEMAVPENRKSLRSKRSVSAFLSQMVRQNRAREVPNPEGCRLAFQKLPNDNRGAGINPRQLKESLPEIPTEARLQPQQVNQMKPMDVLMQAAEDLVRVLERIEEEMREVNEVLRHKIGT